MGKDSIVCPSDYSVRLTGGEEYKVTIFYYASEDLPLGEYHIRIEVLY